MKQMLHTLILPEFIYYRNNSFNIKGQVLEEQKSALIPGGSVLICPSLFPA